MCPKDTLQEPETNDKKWHLLVMMFTVQLETKDPHMKNDIR